MDQNRKKPKDAKKECHALHPTFQPPFFWNVLWPWANLRRHAPGAFACRAGLGEETIWLSWPPLLCQILRRMVENHQDWSPCKSLPPQLAVLWGAVLMRAHSHPELAVGLKLKQIEKTQKKSSKSVSVKLTSNCNLLFIYTWTTHMLDDTHGGWHSSFMHGPPKKNMPYTRYASTTTHKLPEAMRLQTKEYKTFYGTLCK